LLYSRGGWDQGGNQIEKKKTTKVGGKGRTQNINNGGLVKKKAAGKEVPKQKKSKFSEH